MSFDAAKFRRIFPEFSCVSSYDAEVLSFYSEEAMAFVNFDKWGGLYEKGLFLYVAHLLKVFSGQNSGVDNAGAVASKAVGSVSVSYDAANSATLGAGSLNETKYGRAFARLQRFVGRGAALV